MDATFTTKTRDTLNKYCFLIQKEWVPKAMAMAIDIGLNRLVSCHVLASWMMNVTSNCPDDRYHRNFSGFGVSWVAEERNCVWDWEKVTF